MKINEATRLRVLYFLAFSCTVAWQPVFADYLSSRGITGSRLAILLGITPFLLFTVQPFYGMIADRYGYKKCLVISAILASISFLGYLSEGSFLYLAIVTICMSIFYNSTQPLLDSLSLNFIKRNPSFSYGSLRIAGAAGWAFTGIIIGYFIEKMSTTVIFASSAISMLLTFVVALFLRYDSTQHLVQDKLSVTKDLREILQNTRLMLLLTGVFLAYAASTPIYYFYTIYLKQNGATNSFVGYALSFQGLCELPFFYFSAAIIGKLGTRNTLIIAVFATALRLLFYNLLKDPHWVFPIELLQGVGWSLFWAASVEQVNVLVRDELRATSQSFLTGAMLGAGAIAGNFWTTFLSEKQLPVSQIYLLNSAVVVAIGVFMMLTLPRVPRRSTGLGTSPQT